MKKIKSNQPHPFVRSIRDLRHRQELLQTKADLLEHAIDSGYHEIVDTLTLRNLFESVSRDLLASNVLLSKAFTIGKFLIDRRKNRKSLKKNRENKRP